MERAAKEVHLTPSAFTRRIQRLESELGVALLDRHFKPPRLTPAGLEVLERSRGILASLSELKAAVAGKAPPTGPFRVGLSHALSLPEVAEAIIELGSEFPLLRPNVGSDISARLLARLRQGELDGALVVLPVTSPFPTELEGVTLAEEPMLVIEARVPRSPARSARRPLDLRRCSWVLNPPGCLVRAELERRAERLGGSVTVAAELHSSDLQLALVAGKVGLGLVRASVLRAHPLRRELRVIDHAAFALSIQISFVRGSHLGSREPVALAFQRMLQRRFARIGEPARRRRAPAAIHGLQGRGGNS